MNNDITNSDKIEEASEVAKAAEGEVEESAEDALQIKTGVVGGARRKTRSINKPTARCM